MSIGKKDAPVDVVVDALVTAVFQLGRAGQPQRANRLAAAAFVAVRHDFPRAAQRLNGVMHALAKMESTASTPPSSRKDPEMPQTLDVRTEPPARRHQLIFESFDGLTPGDHFELVNDHDPKPLYYQFEAEHSDTFTWDYVEQGPEVWRVKIGRKAA